MIGIIMSVDPNKKYLIGDKVPQSGLYSCYDSATGKSLDITHHDKHTDDETHVFPPKPGGEKGDCYYKWSHLN